MQFEYHIIDRKHKRNRGSIEANSLTEARNILKEKEAFIIYLKQKQDLWQQWQGLNKKSWPS